MVMLKIGDKVKWRGNFGNGATKIATVENIEVCERGSKYGEQVKEVSWHKVINNRDVVVDLDSGHWAYGTQISKL